MCGVVWVFVSLYDYLYELYDIYCHNLNWLTGWEISKKIYEKIINNNDIDIFLSDKKLRKQIMGIQTDSTPLDEPKETENCNVFQLYRLLATDQQTTNLKAKYAAGNFGYGEAKQELFEVICDKFSDEKEKFNHLMENKNIIEDELQKGAEKAKAIAKEVLNRVRKNIGY